MVINVAKYSTGIHQIDLTLKKPLWGYQWGTGEWLEGEGEAAKIGECAEL